jgi:hypothetical protein
MVRKKSRRGRVTRERKEMGREGRRERGRQSGRVAE